MEKDIDTILCTKYPKIFRDRHASMQVTAMCWGISVGDGWFNILDRLCANIQWHIDGSRASRLSALRYNRALKQAIAGDKRALIKNHTYNNQITPTGLERVETDIADKNFRDVPEACPQVVAAQVKEKFGSLRFYYDGGDDIIDGMVRMAEAMSEVTCESCAGPSMIGGSGWLSTVCNKCKAKQKREQAKRKVLETTNV